MTNDRRLLLALLHTNPDTEFNIGYTQSDKQVRISCQLGRHGGPHSYELFVGHRSFNEYTTLGELEEVLVKIGVI